MAINIKTLILQRPLRLNDIRDHKIIWKRGFLAAFIYSIAYGFYEYFIVYNYVRLVDILESEGGWVIM